MVSAPSSLPPVSAMVAEVGVEPRIGTHTHTPFATSDTFHCLTHLGPLLTQGWLSIPDALAPNIWGRGEENKFAANPLGAGKGSGMGQRHT